jgi:hypothetical protein
MLDLRVSLCPSMVPLQELANACRGSRASCRRMHKFHAFEQQFGQGHRKRLIVLKPSTEESFQLHLGHELPMKVP